MILRLQFITRILLIFFNSLLWPGLAISQVLQVESFESTIFPAPGWQQKKVVTTSTGAFTAQTGALTNPVATPPNGAKVMIFNSATAAVNDTAIMITKPFDFSSCGTTNPVFSFQMYNDNGAQNSADHIRVFVNTVPSLNGAVPVNHQGGTNQIFRYSAATPNMWNTYNFSLNANTYNAGPKKTYIILLGVAKGGLNIYIDNFQVVTFPSPTLSGDVSMDVVQQNTASIGTSTTNQWIIGVRCVVGGNSGCGNISLGTALKLDSMMFNTFGTTSLSDIQNARVWYTGGSQLFSTGYISPYPGGGYPSTNYGSTIANIPFTSIYFQNNSPNCFHLEYDTSYFWLTYDVKATATPGNALDAEFVAATVSPGGGPCPTPPGSVTSLQVTTTQYSLSGNAEINLPYCIPAYFSGTSMGPNQSGDFVQRVEFLTGVAPSYINTYVNSVNLQNPLSPCYPNCPYVSHPPDYELWAKVAGQTVNLSQGGSYSFRAQCGTWSANNYIQAWIDFNHDGDFLDAGEKLASSLTNLSANTWQQFNFTVPAAGYTGNTRMRVREAFATSNMDPCASYSYGETEDFDITIMPNCPAGYKLWLGYSSDWTDPANWCGGVPTSADSAAMNKSIVPGVTGRPYYYASIGNNVKAYTKGLFISPLDTLIINAPIPSDTSLKVNGSLTLQGKFEVKSGAGATISSGTGTLENSIYTPFRGSVTDARMQLFYSAAELASWGLVAGDQITAIRFNIIPFTNTGGPGKNSTIPFSNFTVSYGLQAGASTGFNSNTPLATPNTVFGPASFTTVSGSNTINLTNPIVWNGTSALVIQYCFNNTSVSGNDFLYITQTTGRKTALLLTSTTTTNPGGCSLVPGTGVSDNFFATGGSNRPNFSFDISRVYGKPNICVRRDWNNNGFFSAGDSRVILDSLVNQSITGNSVTTFHELEISKTTAAAQIILQRAIIVNDTLDLRQGILSLNKKSLSLYNPNGSTNPGAAAISTIGGPITRTSGMILSEDSLSKVIWNTNITLPANGLFRVIPFVNAAGNFIPFSFRQTSGDLGMFSVATYVTTSQNLPYPPSVFHINDTGAVAVNNSAAAADRYWITQKGNSAAVADLTFRWAQSERPVSPVFNALSNPARVYPWRLSSNFIGTWLRTYSTPATSGAQLMVATPYTQNYGINGAVFDSARISGFDWPMIVAGNAPWTTPAEPMPTYTVWAVAGSNATGALGNGLGNLIVLFDSVHADCDQSGNGQIFITTMGGISPYSYIWSNGNAMEDPSGLSAGNYTVIVTDANGATASIIVNVPSAATPATPGTLTGPARVCPGSNGVVYSIPNVSGATKYQWTIPSWMHATTSLTGSSITVNIDPVVTPGNVEVRAGNECGFSAVRMKTVRSIVPGTPGTISGPASGVCGATHTYSIAAVNQATTYNWVVPVNAVIISGQGTTSVQVAFNTIYGIDTIKVSAGNSCAFGPARKLTVKGKPAVPGVITGPATACNGQTGVIYSITPVFGANSYTWNKPTGSTITAGQGTTQATLKFGAVSGNITVKAVNTCGTSSPSTKAITIICREGELTNNVIEIYPNPSQSEFALSGKFENGPVQIQVFDMTGKEIYKGLHDASQKFGIDFVPGVYVVHFTDAGEERNIRIVKM